MCTDQSVDCELGTTASDSVQLKHCKNVSGGVDQPFVHGTVVHASLSQYISTRNLDLDLDL